MIKSSDLENAIDVMVDYILGEMRGSPRWTLVAIADGGIAMRDRLHRIILARTGVDLPRGELNVSFHRDDIGHRPIVKVSEPTRIDGSVDDVGIFLFDDVMMSGRTVRSALDELFELGRPRVVKLIALIDRGYRVLPIQPDFVGFSIETHQSQTVKVVIDPENPEGHRIEISDRAPS